MNGKFPTYQKSDTQCKTLKTEHKLHWHALNRFRLILSIMDKDAKVDSCLRIQGGLSVVAKLIVTDYVEAVWRFYFFFLHLILAFVLYSHTARMKSNEPEMLICTCYWEIFRKHTSLVIPTIFLKFLFIYPRYG